MPIHRASLALALALAFATPRPASAEDTASVARTLGDEGLRRFQAGRWQEAYELFQQATSSLRAPTLLVYMGHCQARMGNLLAARRFYREVALQEIEKSAPLQFQTAQGVARQELRWVESRLAHVRVFVTGTPAGEVRVLVDGATVPADDLADLFVEPGTHVIEATTRGGRVVRRTIEASAGGTVDAMLSLPVAAGRSSVDAMPPLATEGSAAPPAPAEPRGKPSLLLPAGVALGVGGAAMVVGAVTGGVSFEIAQGVKSRCPSPGHCLASDRPNEGLSGRLADASTGAFILGGVAAAAGLVLITLHARSHKVPSTGALHVDLGPGYGAVRGSFQ